MHIVQHVTNISATEGGIAHAAVDLAKILAARGHRITFLAAGSTGLLEEAAAGHGDHLAFVDLNPIRPRFGLLSSAQSRPVTAALESADVLHLHGLWEPRNYQLARRALRQGLPYVVSPHGMLHGWALRHHRVRKSLYYRLFEKHVLAGARLLHVSTEREKEEARARVDPARLRVVPMPVDLSPYRHETAACGDRRTPGGIDDDGPALLVVSRIDPIKRIEILIEAVALLRQEGVACRLLIAGDGDRSYLRELEELSRRRHVDDRTRFLGFSTGTEKLALYRRAAITALPSRRESFGLVLFESLACGTPALATRGVDTWADLLESGGVRLVEPTARSFADGIAELLADVDLRDRMGREGSKWVFRWLAPDALAARYEQLYCDSMACDRLKPSRRSELGPPPR